MNFGQSFCIIRKLSSVTKNYYKSIVVIHLHSSIHNAQQLSRFHILVVVGLRLHVIQTQLIFKTKRFTVWRVFDVIDVKKILNTKFIKHLVC